MKSAIFLIDKMIEMNTYEASQHNVTVRCQGVNSKGMTVGIDFELDPVDRLVSMTEAEGGSAFPVDLTTLDAPSLYLKLDAKGHLEVFGFKSFNDGLEEVFSVLFVRG